MNDPYQRLFASVWLGPVLVGLGVLLLATQVLLWLYEGYLHSWLIGMGITLPVLGGFAWFYYIDDRAHGKPLRPNEEELPTADEYDRLLDDFDGEV